MHLLDLIGENLGAGFTSGWQQAAQSRQKAKDLELASLLRRQEAREAAEARREDARAAAQERRDLETMKLEQAQRLGELKLAQASTESETAFQRKLQQQIQEREANLEAFRRAGLSDEEALLASLSPEYRKEFSKAQFAPPPSVGATGKYLSIAASRAGAPPREDPLSFLSPTDQAAEEDVLAPTAQQEDLAGEAAPLSPAESGGFAQEGDAGDQTLTMGRLINQLTPYEMAQWAEEDPRGFNAAYKQAQDERTLSLGREKLGQAKAQHEETMEFKREHAQRQESKNYIEETEKAWETALQGKADLARMTDLLPDTNSPLSYAALNKIGMPWLLNPASAEFDKLRVGFLRGAKDVFGGQVRVSEMQVFMQGLPDLLKSKGANNAVLRNMNIAYEAMELKADTMREIIEEHGGVPPHNLKSLVNQRIGPTLKALGKRFAKGMKTSNYKGAPPEKLTESLNKKFPPERYQKGDKVEAKGFWWENTGKTWEPI